MTCVFFGHRDCPDSVKPRLLDAIRKQIEGGATRFYVGTNGRFDAMALACLRVLKREYPEIRYAAVLSRFPSDPTAFPPDETILSDGIEIVPPRFVIDYRNRWMIARADVVIAYRSRSFGGTAKNVGRAERKGVLVVNLSDGAGG